MIEDQLGRQLPMFDYFAGNRIFGIRIIKFHVYLLLLNNRSLTQLPGDIGRLRSLRALDAGRNRLTHLPTSLGECTDLTQLFLGRNQLRVYPEELLTLHNLKILELQNNKLVSLPELGSYSNLERLFIHGNNMDATPSGLENLSVLKELRLDNNEIQKVNIPHLPVLWNLNVSENKLEELSLTADILPSLTTLDLSNNSLKRFPDLSEFEKLEVLNLSGNQISCIDYDQLSNLPSLKQLIIRHNPIPDLANEKLIAFSRFIPQKIEVIA